MEKYVIEKVIGEGTYGVVYKAKEKGSKEYVAIKKFKTITDEQLSKREIQACSMLNHPFIVSYRHSFRHEGLLHLVFDYICDSMNKVLARNRSGIKPLDARRLTYQLCLALQCCHSNQIIHRDVKPDNILIDQAGDIKLCDFGVARTIQFEGDPLSDYVATRWYRPPEQELRLDRYSFDADMWSVGCVLMELLTGKPLFPGNTQVDQINLIQDLLGPLPPALLPRLPRGVAQVKKGTKSLQDLLGSRSLPDGTLDFLTNTLQLDPKSRLSAALSLSHSFLRPLRDADLKERKNRQLEEKRKQQRSSGDCDDSIEEEIPGEKQASCPPSGFEAQADAKAPTVSTPTYKAGPRTFDFKSLDKASSSTAGSVTKPKDRRLVVSGLRAPAKHSDNNTAECDSDDIQEIIEMDENAPGTPQHHHSAGSKQNGFNGNSNPPRSKHLRRRNSSADGKDVDPLDHECYEDDFEDYHS
ncbi:Cyclin-dependent Kinase [Globisporangium polare]